MCWSRRDGCEFLALFLTVLLLQGTEALTFSIVPTVIQGDICSSIEERQTAIKNIRNFTESLISDAILGNQTHMCGDGLWYQAAYINMNDSGHHCPTQWREYMSNSVRVCGRPESSSPSCASVTFSIGLRYSRVCGRIIGYQVGSPDAFFTSRTIDQIYADGVSVTYGTPRQHIWTFAGGVVETEIQHFSYDSCPCLSDNAEEPPSFVGQNYFCESGNPHNNFTAKFLYSNDKLWDGQQCNDEGACCTNAPWFHVQLLHSTSDSIEVRICGSETTDNEDSPLELLEIYVQ